MMVTAGVWAASFNAMRARVGSNALDPVIYTGLGKVVASLQGGICAITRAPLQSTFVAIARVQSVLVGFILVLHRCNRLPPDAGAP